jgi:phosphate transport system protein
MGVLNVRPVDPLVLWPGDRDTLESLDAIVVRIFRLVREALEGATEIFMSADRVAARNLAEREQLIDALHLQAENMVVEALIHPSEFNLAERHRHLLIVRILPELERSGDLAQHIASHASRGLAEWLNPTARMLVAQMGSIGAEMWGMAADAFESGDGHVADLLRVRDDEIDDHHVRLTAELAAERVSVPVAIEMALVARFFERLGDHAYNIARRIQAMNHDLGQGEGARR